MAPGRCLAGVLGLAAVCGCAIDLVPLRLAGPRQRNAGRVVAIREGQTYAVRGGQPLQYDLYRPADAGAAPLVVLVHGGSWRSGDRFHLLEWCYDLAANGWAAATIDYRLTRQGVAYPAPVADVLAAIRHFREHAAVMGIDPGRIALFGQSAGAHLALLAGLAGDASRFDADHPPGEAAGVACVVDLFGPTDLTVDPAGVEPDLVRRVEGFLGSSIGEAGALLAEASPARHVRAGGPAVLIIHGDADRTVPVDQARRLAEALRAAGQPHRYVEVPGMDHLPGAIWQGPFAQEYRDEVLEFLRAFL
jgi:acetyl esterase/lipase